MPRKKSVAAASDPAHDEDGGIEAFELQKAVVARLIKAALPEDVKLQKDVPLALVKGSTVFISYLAALAHDTATERNHKTIAASHVLDAVKALGWDDGGQLQKSLKKELAAAFRAANDAKKQGRAPPPVAPKPKAKPPTTSRPAPAAAAVPAAAAAADGEAGAQAEGGNGGDAMEGVTVLRDDGPNADAAAAAADADAGTAEDEAAEAEIELYADEDDGDEEMDDEVGSEGVDEDEPAGAAAQLDGDEDEYREG
ncbi:hypothetical protein Rhopal_002149-T1 [Rhodotorula paludigena]|uniref:DNA polymerase epsilon subunit D n=1 Tax=Rhodotorula paludigena TaxID=86838 RepID=A0AAV5GI52_9BASI|nr:hypothetical protein Rhopal_002149-T1 [Rhodotorula paludigena]